ncbi:MAG: AprI/Inh family metalloprotease inhibitor, partial [Brevundimonas sp.]|uniref:AprI/Inh family metalloprotease inhibitor n=1 Tax=Brevundimonas sp. TaxID=1871086 RepID=UPI002732522E
MSDATSATGQDARVLGPDTVSGLWALHASDRPDENSCRIALQKIGQGGVYGVYLEGCEGTALARVAGWRVLEDTVALLDAGGEPILRFRNAGPDLLEASSGGVTYRLEPAAMM